MIGETRGYLEELKEWLAWENQIAAVASISSENANTDCIQTQIMQPTEQEHQSQERLSLQSQTINPQQLQSTAIDHVYQPDDSVVRFRNSFMNTQSIERAAETRNAQNAATARQTPLQAQAPAQPESNRLYYPPVNPIRHPFSWTGATSTTTASNESTIQSATATVIGPADRNVTVRPATVPSHQPMIPSQPTGLPPQIPDRAAQPTKFPTHSVNLPVMRENMGGYQVEQIRLRPQSTSLPIAPQKESSAADPQARVPLIFQQQDQAAPLSEDAHRLDPLAQDPFSEPFAPSQQQIAPAREPSNQYSLGRKAREVPKFSGDTREFRKWQQLFRVFVDDTPAPTMEKYNLLRRSLSGKALDAISHLQWEESHYSLAKNLIQERFGDSKLAQKSHVREIDKLLERGPITNNRVESFSETLALNVKALIALGSSYSELSTATIQRVLRCLPTDLREKFIKKMEKRRLLDPLVTELEFMLEFLTYTAKVRRQAELDGSSTTPQQNTKKQTFQQPRNPPPRPRHFNTQPFPSQRESHNFLTTEPQAPPQPRTNNNVQRQVDRSCVFCGETHASFRCKATLTHEERMERLEQQKACRVCLKRNHDSKTCREGPKRNCPKCDGRHYIIMCRKAQLDSSTFLIATTTTTATTPTLTTLNSEASPSTVTTVAATIEVPQPTMEQDILLQMAVVWVEAGAKRCLARILLDSGSHRSYITSDLINRIGAVPLATLKTSMKTMGNFVTTLDTWLHRVKISSQHDPLKSVTIECIETPSITDSIFPSVVENFGLEPVADQRIHTESPQSISIMIGTADMAFIHTGVEKTFGRMLATSTIFGWVFSGSLQAPSSPTGTIALLCDETKSSQSSIMIPRSRKPKKTKDTSLNNDMKFLWEGEFLGVDPSIAEERDSLIEELGKFFDSTIETRPDGGYILSLPFQDNLHALGDNENLTRSRLHTFLKKLSKDPVKLAAVDNEIRKYLEKGFAEEAQPRKQGQFAHFLPLHICICICIYGYHQMSRRQGRREPQKP